MAGIGISVVIPVYNTASYLGRCLDSVLAQGIESLEVLCIDDCSSDDSADIVRRYASADSRVHLILMDSHSGVSAARNRGMSEASGDYVYFMDSDDWIEEGFLSNLLCHALASGQDITVSADFITDFFDGSESKPGGDCGFVREGANYYPARQVQAYFYRVVWLRLYRREFLIRNNLWFIDTPDGAEDDNFVSLSELLQQRSYIVHGPLYHHLYLREGSLVRSGVRFGQIVAGADLLAQLVRRGVSPEGVKLFYAGNLLLDSSQRFDVAKAFFTESEAFIRSSMQLYTRFDIFCMEAVLSSPDYADFRANYNPSMALSFVRRLGR